MSNANKKTRQANVTHVDLTQPYLINSYFGRIRFTVFQNRNKWNRPLSLGSHVESQENKKLCFCMARLALNSRLGKASCAKTKFFILLRLNMTPRDKGLQLLGRHFCKLLLSCTPVTHETSYKEFLVISVRIPILEKGQSNAPIVHLFLIVAFL